MTNTYTTIVKKSMLLLICLFPLGSFATQMVKPENIVILLDLSDRLIIPNQGLRDTTIIMEAWRSFEKKAKARLIVTCKNRFSIVLAPQENTAPELLNIQHTLSIDLGSIPPAQKLKSLQNFSANLPAKIARLYHLAIRGKHPSDYPGADIWRYFNEQLHLDAPSEYQNKLIVLTDGYFDFENINNKKRVVNQYTTTAFLSNLPDNNWESYAKSKKMGLLPVDRHFTGIEVKVIGLTNKTGKQEEIPILTYFWRAWLVQMGITEVGIYQSGVNAMVFTNKF